MEYSFLAVVFSFYFFYPLWLFVSFFLAFLNKRKGKRYFFIPALFYFLSLFFTALFPSAPRQNLRWLLFLSVLSTDAGLFLTLYITHKHFSSYSQNQDILSSKWVKIVRFWRWGSFVVFGGSLVFNLFATFLFLIKGSF